MVNDSILYFISFSQYLKYDNLLLPDKYSLHDFKYDRKNLELFSMTFSLSQ